MAMEISMSILIKRQNGHGNFHASFDTKTKWPWKFPCQFLIQRQMAVDFSMSVFDTKAKWPWKFPRQFLIQRQNCHRNFQRLFLAEVQSEH